MRPPREDTKPWYRQFWPWFLIALPGSVVIASFVTIMLAVNTDDSLVRDDYYKEGLAINQDMARERNAASLSVQVTLNYDLTTGTIVASLNDAAVGKLDHLELMLAHPTLAAQDATLPLTRVGDREFTGHVTLTSGSAAWHVEVTPPGGTWKLRGRWNPTKQPNIALSASLPKPGYSDARM